MSTHILEHAAPATRSPGMSFDGQAIAADYDRVIAPVLFESWTARLIEDHGPWEGRRVLDLATGTGIVAQRLAAQVGPGGAVTGADINGTMLAMARKRCADLPVRFVETPAHPLDVEDGSVDVVTCQQGFQFFPDKHAAANEVHRVLRDGGKVVASTWLPVSECSVFGAICTALDSIGEPEIADAMRAPFDHLPAADLVAPFVAAGFADVRLRKLKQDLVMDGGIAAGVEFAYATPIGPQLAALSEDWQALFRVTLTGLLETLSEDGTTMGRMVTHELTARKPA